MIDRKLILIESEGDVMELNEVEKETIIRVCDFYLSYKHASDSLKNTVRNIKSNVNHDIYDKDCYQMLNHYGWNFCIDNDKHFKNVLNVMNKIKN